MSYRVLWGWRQGKADSIPWRSSHTQNSPISCAFLAGGGSRRWMPSLALFVLQYLHVCLVKTCLCPEDWAKAVPPGSTPTWGCLLKVATAQIKWMWCWHIKPFWESGIKPGLCHWQLWSAARCDHSLQTSQLLKVYESVTISLFTAVLCITGYYKNFRGRKKSCKREDNLCFWINFYVLFF